MPCLSCSSGSTLPLADHLRYRQPHFYATVSRIPTLPSAVRHLQEPASPTLVTTSSSNIHKWRVRARFTHHSWMFVGSLADVRRVARGCSAGCYRLAAHAPAGRPSCAVLPWKGDQRTCPRHLPVPAPARRQPGGLARMGARRLRRGAPPGRADPAVRGLRRLPLVPCNGPRVLLRRAGGRSDERPVRAGEGRSE